MTDKERITQLEARLAQAEARLAAIERKSAPLSVFYPPQYQPYWVTPTTTDWKWRPDEVWCGAVGYTDDKATKGQ